MSVRVETCGAGKSLYVSSIAKRESAIRMCLFWYHRHSLWNYQARLLLSY